MAGVKMETVLKVLQNCILTESGMKKIVSDAKLFEGQRVFTFQDIVLLGNERKSSEIPYVFEEILLEDFLTLYMYDAANFFVTNLFDNEKFEGEKDEKNSTNFSNEIMSFLNKNIGISGVANNSKGDRFYFFDKNKRGVANSKGDIQYIDMPGQFANCHVKSDDTISFLFFVSETLHKVEGTKVSDFSYSTENIKIGSELIKNNKISILNYLSSCNVAKNESYSEYQQVLFDVLLRTEKKDYFVGRASFSASGFSDGDVRKAVNGSCSAIFVYDYTEKQVIACWETKTLTNNTIQVERVYDNSHKDISLIMNDDTKLILRDCILNNGIEVAKIDVTHKNKTIELIPSTTQNTANGHPVCCVLPTTKLPQMLIHKNNLICIDKRYYNINNKGAWLTHFELIDLISEEKREYVNKAAEIANLAYCFVKQ